MKVIDVKYVGYKLIGPDPLHDYDSWQEKVLTCSVPVTDEIYKVLEHNDTDENDDWAWDFLECAVDALANCAGYYMKSIECLEV